MPDWVPGMLVNLAGWLVALGVLWQKVADLSKGHDKLSARVDDEVAELVRKDVLSTQLERTESVVREHIAAYRLAQSEQTSASQDMRHRLRNIELALMTHQQSIVKP